jgi:hypothetical protein
VGKAIDPLTEKWPVETVAALEGGKTMLITLDAGGADVAGEAVHQYFLVTDTKDGGTSLRIAFTPVRVVCQNTLVTGLRSAMVQCNLQHRQSVSAELDLRVYLVGKMQEAQNSVMADFNSLAKAVLSQDEVEAVMAAAYPYPKRSAKATLADELFAGAVDLSAYGDTKGELEDAVRGYGSATAHMDVLRAGAGELLVKYNDEQPALANTAWSAYNAVVEVEDYRNGKGDVGYSALWGGRAKHKQDAFSIALRIAKAQGKYAGSSRPVPAAGPSQRVRWAREGNLTRRAHGNKQAAVPGDHQRRHPCVGRGDHAGADPGRGGDVRGRDGVGQGKR